MQAESALLEVGLQFFPASLVLLSLGMFPSDEHTAAKQQRLQSLVQNIVADEGASLNTSHSNEEGDALSKQHIWVNISSVCTAIETILDFQKSAVR